jgi:putative transcriptional regulator
LANTLTQAIGSIVTDLRTSAHLSQEQVAALVGCSSRTITGIERGEHSVRVDVLENVANHFGLSLSELFQRAENLRSQGREVPVNE